MEWWQILLIVLGTGLVLFAVGTFLLWRTASGRTRRLAERITRLPLQSRIVLLRRLLSDRRIPLRTRLIPPLLVLYLALPLRLIPRFVPVLGQLHGLAVAIVAVALFSRHAPLQVIEAHLDDLEARAASEPPAAR